MLIHCFVKITVYIIDIRISCVNIRVHKTVCVYKRNHLSLCTRVYSMCCNLDFVVLGLLVCIVSGIVTLFTSLSLNILIG